MPYFVALNKDLSQKNGNSFNMLRF